VRIVDQSLFARHYVNGVKFAPRAASSLPKHQASRIKSIGWHYHIHEGFIWKLPITRRTDLYPAHVARSPAEGQPESVIPPHPDTEGACFYLQVSLNRRHIRLCTIS